jgi:outer membrane lipoprotein-sorting protein
LALACAVPVHAAPAEAPTRPQRPSAPVSTSQGLGAEALRRRLDSAWAGVRTYEANLKWPNPASAKLEDQGCGLFLFEKPGRWLMEFHTPRMEKYVIKGSEAWAYVAKLKQVVHYRLKAEDRAHLGMLILGQSTSDLAKIYEFKTQLLPEDRAAMHAGPPALILTPREPESTGVRRAILFLDPVSWMPVKVRLQLDSGEDLRMTLEAAKRNHKLDPSVWNVVFPTGTRVVEQ